MNFCFAINGNKSISSRDEILKNLTENYSSQLQSQKKVPSSLNPGFTAVHHGISTTPITPFTTFNVVSGVMGNLPSEMISAVLPIVKQEAEGTFITGELNSCFSQLFNIVNDCPICPRSVIVLMGDGVEIWDPMPLNGANSLRSKVEISSLVHAVANHSPTLRL